jgi:hypothetical protein
VAGNVFPITKAPARPATIASKIGRDRTGEKVAIVTAMEVMVLSLQNAVAAAFVLTVFSLGKSTAISIANASAAHDATAPTAAYLRAGGVQR